MKPLALQPTFVVEVADTAENTITRMRRAISDPELREYTKSAGSCLDFIVEPDQRRFWSPHLSVQIGDPMLGEADWRPAETDQPTESGDPTDSSSTGRCQLYCRFSPRPEVWTMFMGIYAIIIAVAFTGSIYAYAQWYMGGWPWALLLVPIGVLMILGLHFASMIGQQLSSDQMYVLRKRLDRAVEIAFEN